MKKRKKIESLARPLTGVRLPVGAVPALLLLTVLACTGCVKRELEMRPVVTHGQVEIALDWGGDERPQAARFLFYDQNGTLVHEQTGVTDGFKGSLPAGTYRVVVHNTDALQVDYRGMESYETAEVFAQETQSTYDVRSTVPHAADLPCILEPKLVFGTGVCTECTQVVVVAKDTVRATVNPVPLTKELRFNFIIQGATSVKSLTGVLGGVSPGIFLSSGRHNTASACAVEFTAAPTAKSASADYFARMDIFNLQTTQQSPTGTNRMDITLTLDNDEQLEASFDITETFKEIITANGGIIPVEIPVEVSLAVQPLGGITVTVTPWDESGSGGGDFE